MQEEASTLCQWKCFQRCYCRSLWQFTCTIKERPPSVASQPGETPGSSSIDACKEYRMHSAPAVLSHVHQGKKTCTICQRVSNSTQALKVHIRGQHMEDLALQCDQCKNTAGDKYGLDVHKRSHLPPDSRYKCDQCPKSSSQKWHLKQHQQEHQGKFSPCPYCRGTFAQKSGLAAHLPRCPSQEGSPP